MNMIVTVRPPLLHSCLCLTSTSLSLSHSKSIRTYLRLACYSGIHALTPSMTFVGPLVWPSSCLLLYNTSYTRHCDTLKQWTVSHVHEYKKYGVMIHHYTYAYSLTHPFTVDSMIIYNLHTTLATLTLSVACQVGFWIVVDTAGWQALHRWSNFVENKSSTIP